LFYVQADPGEVRPRGLAPGGESDAALNDAAHPDKAAEVEAQSVVEKGLLVKDHRGLTFNGPDRPSSMEKTRFLFVLFSLLATQHSVRRS
jgi:hypothetical protein